MTDDAECSCIVDTDGLHGIATASGNMKTILIDHLEKGLIGVPACAWKEFADLYEDEAEELQSAVAKRIVMRRAFYLGAARIADQLNSGFPRGAHDDNVELLTASIASVLNCPILTSLGQINVYVEMNCEVSDLESWIEAQS